MDWFLYDRPSIMNELISDALRNLVQFIQFKKHGGALLLVKLQASGCIIERDT